MKRTAAERTVAALGSALALALFPGPAPAAPGAAGASFLRFTPSPRANGMGDAYTSVSQDADSAYWNPAGLAAVEVPQLSAMYNASFEDVDTQYLAAAWPLEYGSTLGFGLSRLAVAPFQGYDARGVRTALVDSYGLSAGFSYGRALLKDEISRPVLSAGGGLKYITSRLDSVSARTFALDAGVVYSFRPLNYWMRKIPAQEFRAALAVRNLGPGLKYDKGVTALPSEISLGGSWHSHPAGASSLILSADNVLQAGDGYHLALGAEFTAFQLLSMRLGFRTGQDIGPGIRAGVGFHLARLDLDYSMSPFGDLGNMHKFGLSMKFGAPKALQPLAGETSRAEKAKLIAPREKLEELQLFAQDYISLAKADLAARRYTSALRNLKKAFNLEPALKAGEWGAREKRLGALAKGLRFAETPAREQAFAPGSEQANAAAEAVEAYTDGHDLKALLLAHTAYGADIRGPAVFEELLSLISGLAGIPVRRNEILPKQALIALKLEVAGNTFYVGDFKAAVHECEEVLLLESENPLAWKRLGSAYYALGDAAEARRAYEKVLRLDPEDKSVLKFMELQNWK